MGEFSMEYKIVSAFATKELEVKVNEEIKNGWVPVGGIAMEITVYHDRKDPLICQAMTKG